MTRILIVEDEKSFSEPLAFLLGREGYEVEIAEDGLDALAKFEKLGADLILLDLALKSADKSEPPPICQSLC